MCRNVPGLQCSVGSWSTEHLIGCLRGCTITDKGRLNCGLIPLFPNMQTCRMRSWESEGVAERSGTHHHTHTHTHIPTTPKVAWQKMISAIGNWVGGEGSELSPQPFNCDPISAECLIPKSSVSSLKALRGTFFLGADSPRQQGEQWFQSTWISSQQMEKDNTHSPTHTHVHTHAHTFRSSVTVLDPAECSRTEARAVESPSSQDWGPEKGLTLVTHTGSSSVKRSGKDVTRKVFFPSRKQGFFLPQSGMYVVFEGWNSFGTAFGNLKGWGKTFGFRAFDLTKIF